MAPEFRLYAAKGGGSMIVEAALTVCGAPFEVVDVDWQDTGWDSKVLSNLNPLGQVPVLVLPDGTVMTESAAIVLWLSEAYPDAQLSPAPAHPDRARFLRWLIFCVAAVYPTYTYGDVTKRWVGEDEKSGAGKTLRQTTDDHRKHLWRFVETQIQPAPWFLGERRSALDLYLWPMTFWRPGLDWFRAECPKLHSIGRAIASLPELAAVKARNKE